MNSRDLLQLPNLVSLARIFLAPLAAYFLWLNDPVATGWAIVVVLLAAASDGLDGYLARRRGQVTPLGIALDPVADKIFAGLLVVSLILFRAFPLWLAILILGRDLLILGAGLMLLKGRTLSLPSNLTGKYAFAGTVILLTAYILRFQFAMLLMSIIVPVLLAWSLVSYATVFAAVKAGRPVVLFVDRPVYKRWRTGLVTFGFLLLALMYYWETWA